MSPIELIDDKNTFAHLSAECEQIIDRSKRLPDFVFRRPFARYFAFEHCQIHESKFAEFLFELSNIYGDQSVNYITIDPDPVDYYYRYCAFYGAASFQPSSLIKEYKSVMSRDGDVNSFLNRGGDVGAFWGTSLQWAIFCDRVSWEIAVIAVSGNIGSPETSGLRCLDAQSLSNYIDSQYSGRRDIATDFTRRFFVNYHV